MSLVSGVLGVVMMALGCLGELDVFEVAYSDLVRSGRCVMERGGCVDDEGIGDEINSGDEINVAYDRVKRGIVRIDVDGLYGSGVIWEMGEEEVVIASNRHLLETWDEGSFVTFGNGKKAGGEIVGLSEKSDIGFVSVEIEDIGYEAALGLRAVEQSEAVYKSMDAGERIFIVGSSDGVGETMYEGTFQNGWWYIEEFDAYMILGFCYGKPGMSGGGTFDACGNFIGMMSGGTGGDEIVSLPVTVMMEEYERLK